MDRKSLCFIAIILLLISPAFLRAWTVNQGFETCTEGYVLGTNATCSQGDVRTGTWGMKLNFPSGEHSTGYAQAAAANVYEGGEVWARMYVKYTSPWSWTCSPVVKILRIHVASEDADGNAGYCSILGSTSGYIVSSNEPAGSQHTQATRVGDTGEWVCLEAYLRLSTVSHNSNNETGGIFRIWQNGALVVEELDHPTLQTNYSNWVDSVLIHTYWNGNHPQDQVAYVDDFVITNETPSNTDADGNAMIGPSDWGSDETAPTLAQVTAVSTPSTLTNPAYVFSSSEAGTITYGGLCGNGTLSSAAAGNNTVHWTLTAGTYSNCTITVTDASQNSSGVLSVPSFTIITSLKTAAGGLNFGGSLP